MERMRGEATVVFVTDQLPYPPRNGITLPCFNYLRLLSQRYKIRLVLLSDYDAPIDIELLTRNEQLFGCIEIVNFSRRSRLGRVVGEVRGQFMYQHGWVADGATALEFSEPGLVIVSPMSAVAKFDALGGLEASAGRVRLAAVNDCTAAEYYTRPLMAGLSGKKALKAWLDRVRSWRIGQIEGDLLAKFDAVAIQTSKDKEYLSQFSGRDFTSKILICPNGVNEDLFKVSPRTYSGVGFRVLFLAELSGEYAETVEWLVKHVWPRVHDSVKGANLLIVGKGASRSLRALFAETSGVEHKDFVDSLTEVYESVDVVFCPVFKGFGLINKALEGMAAARPVVGGAAAFNGIAGFEAGMHGVVLSGREPGAAADALIAALMDSEGSQQLGLRARALVCENFNWETTVKRIERLLCMTLPGECEIA